MSLNTLCPAGFGYSLIEEGSPNVCFGEVYLLGVTNLLGILGGIWYWLSYIRLYDNFQMTNVQRKLVDFLFWFKMLSCMVIAFRWIFTRLAYQYQGTYPVFLTIGDTTNMLVWLCMSTILYAERNRGLPHGFIIRAFVLISVAARITNTLSIYYLYYTDRSNLVLYYNNPEVPITITGIQCGIALLMLLGAIPAFQEYLEPSGFQLKETKSVKVSYSGLFKILSGYGLILAMFLLFLGLLVAGIKGFIQQETNKYDGALIDFARQMDIVGMLEMLKVLILFYALYSLGAGVSSLLCLWAAETMMDGKHGLRALLFSSLLRQEMAYFNNQSIRDITSRFSNDCERIRSVLSETLPEFVENLFQVLFGLFYMFQTQWDLTFYLLGIAPLAIGLSYFQSEKLAFYASITHEQNRKMTSLVHNVFSKYQTVLVYGKQDFEAKNYVSLVKASYIQFRERAFFNGVLLAITWLLSYIAEPMAFSLSLQIYRYSFRQYVTYCFYSFTLVQGLMKILELFPSLSVTFSASVPLVDMIKRRPQLPERELNRTLHFQQGVIEFRNVFFTYPNSETEALVNINFEAQANSKVAIVGDHAADNIGTLFELVARFYDPKAGQVLIDGQDISKCSARSVRSKMALVKQDADLFAVSRLENIMYALADPLDGHTQEMIDRLLQSLKEKDTLVRSDGELIHGIMELVQAVNASDFIEKQSDLAKGYNDSSKGLSEGQKRRLSAARVLYRNPKIVLLEEAVTPLDPISEAIVQKVTDLLFHKRTVLVIARRIHTMETADSVLVMDKGKIIDRGKHLELLERSPKYQKIVRNTEDALRMKETTKIKMIWELLKEINEDIAQEDSPPAREIRKILDPVLPARK